MGEFFFKSPRICYEKGNPVTGKKIYEYKAFCTCVDCLNRKAWKNEPCNVATVTIKDISKANEVTEFIKNWECKDGTKHLSNAYFQF